MRRLFYFLGVLIVTVFLALVARQDPGYVLITRGAWSAETTLSLFVIMAAIGFGLLYVLARLAARGWALPPQLVRWRHARRALRARRASRRGLVELAEGHWADAERILSRHAAASDLALVNYLGAARAAQEQNAPARRDHYLALALRSVPEANLAVELTQAELQLSHGQLEQALATLMHLRSIAPKHTYVLLLLMRLFQKLSSWGDLAELIPELRKRRVVSKEEAEQLELTAHTHLLEIAGNSGNTERLHEAWNRVPRDLKHQPELVGTYAIRLIALEQHQQAEQLLRDAINREWNERLAYLYGFARSPEAEQQLRVGEAWLRSREHNATLLLTVGRISLNQRLWGKARAYLEASLANRESDPEAHQLLAELLTQLGETDLAAKHYKAGLLAAAREMTAQRVGAAVDAGTLLSVPKLHRRPALPRSATS